MMERGMTDKLFTLDELMKEVDLKTNYFKSTDHPRLTFQPGWYKKETNSWVGWQKNIYSLLVRCVEKKSDECVWFV